MAGLADLLPSAQPALVGAGANATVTEGRTWVFPVLRGFVDDTGAPIVWGSATVTCKAWDRLGVEVIDLPVAKGSGTLTIGPVTAANTAGLADGVRRGRRCSWGLWVVDGTTKLQVFGPSNSVLTILDEEGVA